MTEQDLRGIVCAQARGWLGRKEADGSHREIIDVYNTIRPLPRGYRMTYSDPWCAAFVSAVAQATNMTEWIYPECACDPMISLYRQHGRWMEDDSYRPQAGDVIFYDWQDSGAGDNTGSSDHVGLVVGVDGNRIIIIEGNCSDMVCYQYRGVNARYIRGYGLPDYAAAAAQEDVIIDDQPAQPAPDEPEKPVEPEKPDVPEKPEAPSELPKGWSNVPLPTLQIGDKWGYVYAAQALLIAHGYDCGNKPLIGKETPDGEFGRCTERAVGFVQSKNGLEVTGIINGPTWAALHQF